MLYDLIIIGAGPAGFSAGLYAARKKIKTLILAENTGGQMMETAEIDNYPGLPNLSGLELMQKMQKHLEKYEDVVLSTGKRVVKIQPEAKNTFQVETAEGKIYHCKSIILANGREHCSLGVPGENKFKGRGVSFCPTCDAPFFTNKIVAVVGTGNSGLESALSLIKFAKKVYLISNTERIFGDKVLQERVFKHKKIEVLYNTNVCAIKGGKNVESIKIQKNKDKKISTASLTVDGIFVHIGYKPSTKWLSNLVKLNQKDEVIIDQNNMTSQAGVFAAGDVTNCLWKQIIVAAGEGAKAALGAERYLEGNF